MIKTTHLQLLPVQRIHKEAFSRRKSELATMLQVAVPEDWPLFPEAFSLPINESLESGQPSMDWGGYFFIHAIDKVLVGNGGFKGPPDELGIVEIGYEIAAEYWNRGFATEAVRGMIDYAFARKDVLAVIAHTLAETNASNCVLRKAGMQFIRAVDDPEEGQIWRWQISRTEYHPT